MAPLLLLVTLTSSVVPPAHVGVELWAHPSMAGSLHSAVAAAAALPASERATIHLAEGVHFLSEPLVLGSQHSGARFVGHGKTVISGGVPVGVPPASLKPDGGKGISGWVAVPGMPAKCAGCLGQVWKAATPKGADSRQFYVNGVRANRTWLPFPANGQKATMGNVITAPGEMLQTFTTNVAAIELVYRGGASAGSQWQESRCPVATIANSTNASVSIAAIGASGDSSQCAADYCPHVECPQDPATGVPINKSSCGVLPCVCPKELPYCVGYVYDHRWGTCSSTPPPPPPHGHTAVTVAQPCAHNGNIKIGGSQALHIPAFMENIKELLGHATYGHPGDYYLDAQEGEVYYVPHTGETPTGTAGQLPMVEQLVQGAGAHDLSFENLAFQHATWMAPSADGYGFVDVQGGYTLHCKEGDSCSKGSGEGPGEARETPAALQFTAAKNITISKCSFAHIGSNAVAFSHGSHENTVRHCHFHDISASAVAIGTRDNPTNKTKDPSLQELNNAVSDCTVTHAAVEYRGHPALLVGFSRGTTLEHNELSMLPYSAISLGWGWSSYPYTYGGLNKINFNHIHDHMRVLGDGGSIYTLGAQGNLPFEMPAKYKNITVILPPSTQIGNWIHDGGTHETALLDHDGLGEGCHCPGGLYSDEGTTNFNLTRNVVQKVEIWLQGCRPGCPWIGPNWQNHNWYDTASQRTINVEARCPLIGDVEVNGSMPAEAVAVMKAAGPRAEH
jgi:hypothetical protein